MSDATRRTLRTVLVVILAIAAMLPVVVSEAGLDLEHTPWLATIVAAAGVINRLVNTSAVDEQLTRIGLGRHARDEELK